MKIKHVRFAVVFLLLLLPYTCFHSLDSEPATSGDDQAEIVTKKRADGTLSSVNQVDENMRVHGVRVTYYADGKTVYSKLTFVHGLKEGPSIRYYENGQIFEHANYREGKKDGLTRKYYKDGRLLSECRYQNGNVLPGLKEYDENGNLITDYPAIQFREIDHLATRNRIDLEISCSEKDRGVKYYLLEEDHEETGRVYLISENSTAIMQYYVKPGETMNKRVEILAEIPTALGNIMARQLGYLLQVPKSK